MTSNAKLEDQKIGEFIAKHGKPFPLGAHVLRATGLVNTTDVWRVVAVKMTERGWRYDLVNAYGNESERAMTRDSHREVQIVERVTWEALP
jgi:hypothetical protein